MFLRFAGLLLGTTMLECAASPTVLADGVRPVTTFYPKQPRVFPVHGSRNRSCIVSANDDGIDDSTNVVTAIDSCNNGGHVIFSSDTTYTIGKALDLTYLQSIDIGTKTPRYMYEVCTGIDISNRYPRSDSVHE